MSKETKTPATLGTEHTLTPTALAPVTDAQLVKDANDRNKVIRKIESISAQIITDTIKTAGKYVALATLIHERIKDNTIDRKTATDCLLNAGFIKTRVSEILRVACADDATWSKFAAKQIGFRAALRLERGSKVIDIMANVEGVSPKQIEGALTMQEGIEAGTIDAATGEPIKAETYTVNVPKATMTPEGGVVAVTPSEPKLPEKLKTPAVPAPANDAELNERQITAIANNLLTRIATDLIPFPAHGVDYCIGNGLVCLIRRHEGLEGKWVWKSNPPITQGDPNNKAKA